MSRRPLPGSPFNKPPAPPAPVKEFAVQDLVTHDRFGLGRVVASETDTVLVDFGVATRRINAPYAKLTRL